MRTVLIDTNVYSLGLMGEDWSSGVLKRADEILLCPVVVGELYAGFRKGSRHAENMEVFNDFMLTPRVTLVSISVATSEFYGLILEQLRKDGAPVPANDIWIAASAMEHGAHVATMDHHFKAIAGLLTLYP